VLEKWTGEVVGTAHIYGIKLNELAQECGMSKQALSYYLNGHKKSPSAEPRIRRALMNLVERKEPHDEAEDEQE
jgi:transcriptional regulator with XRE-family HTH domain